VKKRELVFILAFTLLLAPFAGAQSRQTGNVRGVVTDVSGEPLPGVAVTATSPSLIGVISDVTQDDGSFRLPGLPPGTYTILVELSGFKTIRREGIIVRVAQVISINMQMEATSIAEEVTVTASAPVIDVQSLKLSTRVDSETLAKLPLGRQFGNIVKMTPGVIEDFTEKMTGMSTGIMHGGTAYSNSFEVDGVNVNDPAHNAAVLFTPQYDAIEEVDVETGALSAQVGNTAGNFVNVVTKSGGNEFHGAVSGYYNNEDMVQVLFPDEQLKATGIGKPAAPIYNYNASGSLGGPVIKDKLWFFSTLALEKSKNRGTFIPTVINGKAYSQYDLPNQFLDGFLKLTTQFSSKIRLFVMAGYSDQDLPIDGSGARSTIDNRFSKMNNRRTTGTANMSWQLSANSILDLRAGFSRFDYPITATKEMLSTGGVGYNDGYTGYGWGYMTSWESDIHRTNLQTSARLTQYIDNLLGGNHEIGAGIEYSRGEENWGLYRPDPLNWTFYNGNPLYYRGQFGLDGPHPTYGDGQLMFQIYGPDKDGSRTKPSKKGIGAYFQDDVTFNNRLTVSLGVRFDSVTGFVPAAVHKSVTSALALSIGENIIKPTYGFNPFGENSTPAWNKAMQWTSISPRIGLSYDIFGDGKTALKVSFAQYREALPAMYYQGNHPFSQSQWGWNPLRFRWWDNNNNGVPDVAPVDNYVLYAGNVSDYDPNPATYTAKIGKDIKAPGYNEFIVGIDRELFKEFRVSAKYFYREKKNAVDTVLYDRATNQPWYTIDQKPEWWVPFTTIVPAYGVYPAQEVTVYFPSVSSPWTNRFNLFTNVPESTRKYNAVEITFDKRFSQGWSLGGSVVFSKTTGNNTGRAGGTHGFSGGYDNPNWFVNREGRTDDDRPLALKLYGAVDIPLGFTASFFVTHYSGFPYQETVSVYAPTGWAAANGAIDTGSVGVLAEKAGSRRNQNVTNVDARLEKGISVGAGKRVSLAIDVFNLLGNRYIYYGVDPAMTWRPKAEGASAGTSTISSNYGKINSISGTRIYKLSLRFAF